MNMKHIVVPGIMFIASVTTAFAAVGDYKETACTQAYFTANSCDQCFTGNDIAAGDQIAGLYDSWINKNTTEQIAYKDEQTWPEVVGLTAGTTFSANPIDANTFWKYGSAVIWADSTTGSGKQEFMLEAGKTVKFMEADLGASYVLNATDGKNGDVIALAKFPLNYHNVDADGNEGKKETHTECVAYAAKGVVTKAAPAEVIKPAPIEPKKMTAVKTGPESIILFALSLLLAAGFIAFRSRKA